TDPFFVVNDKPAITADPTNPTYAYLTWDRYDIIPNLQPTYFARTTDGGQTWSTPVAIYDPGFNLGTLSNQIVVMPNGTLVDMFAEFNFSTGDVSIKVIRSTDHGQTWSGPTLVSPLEQVYETDADHLIPVRAGDIPDIAVDAKTGALYVVFQS